MPDDADRYGPLAGKIIAGAEQQGLMYAFDATGAFTTHALGVAIEDIDLITADENFFGVNFGTGRILGAPASEFSAMAGDILLTSEFGGSTSLLYHLRWDGTNLVTSELPLGPNSAVPGQWEHVTFAPAGIVEIPGIPEPASGVALLGGLALMRGGRGRRRAVTSG